jgi:hypothetical protein
MTARVLQGRKARYAQHQAVLMGGEYDETEEIWHFRMTPVFERKGGVIRLRAAGLLPLERWSGARVEAVWVDHDCLTLEPIMSWRPTG